MIGISDVSAGYNSEVVLEHINMTVCQQDFIGIIGPNGGGKTTLVKLIIGLIKPMSGKINFYFDRKLTTGSIGYIPQVHNFDRKFPISVMDTVLSGLSYSNRITQRYSKPEKRNAIQLMEQLGIEMLYKKSLGELSGGQLQRVMVCRALISEPGILILDEPNTFVDNQFENELYTLLKKLNENITIILVTHDIGIVSAYIKTIACVNRELHYHDSNIITEKQLLAYNCPIQLITHGEIPHTVLKAHQPHDHD